jgi:orotate phosphoribosyltransferase-like protein
MGTSCTRELDEKVLTWVRLRRRGLTAGQIAKRYNVKANSVILATTRVRLADLTESGEPNRNVVEGYW